MKSDRIKQVKCICADNAEDFQDKLNEQLMHLDNPEITYFKDMPYYAIITYVVKRDMPESIIELFEMVDGRSYVCAACPHFSKTDDKRKKWGSCSASCIPMRMDSPVCESFYLLRYKMLSEAKGKYLERPYKAI